MLFLQSIEMISYLLKIKCFIVLKPLYFNGEENIEKFRLGYWSSEIKAEKAQGLRGSKEGRW